MPIPPFLTIGDVDGAAERLRDRIHVTPVISSRQIGAMTGTRLFFKCECLQKTGSFKPRGMLNKILRLPADATARGVVTISAGNAAQALAWAAAEAGIPCTVVMPAGASPIKAAASRGYGADVLMHGTVHEAFAKARHLADDEGFAFIHPFDDRDIVEGTATIGREILAQVDNVDCVIVPVGGGGLIGGIAACIKIVAPAVRVYGVEPEGACAMRQSLDAGRVVHLESVASVADGLAPPMAGELNYAIVKEAVDDVVTVTDDQILHAMQLIWSRAKLVAEPSGAAGLAALTAGRVPDTKDKTVVVVISGGNVNLDLLPEYASRWNPRP